MPDSRAVDYSGVRRHILVYGVDRHQWDPERRNRRDAATYIDRGHRVTDDFGFNLTIEVRADGTRRVVRGPDAFGEFNERNRLRTIARAQQTDAAGRPRGLPERKLTDYEVGREHPHECGIPNCDHPVHFGGSATGKLTFEPVDKRPDNSKKHDSGGDVGGANI